MSEGRIISPQITFDPKVYLPDPSVYTIWPSRLYDVLNAGSRQWWLRGLISVTLAVAEYFVGLVLAASIGFTQVYVTTIPVYLLCAAFGFYMGRARWLTVQVPERLKSLRPVFDISDTDFRKAVVRVCHAATNRWVTTLLTTLAILVAWAAVGEYYYGQSAFLRPYVGALVAPTFPDLWHSGSHLITKMIIVDFFIGLGLAFAAPILYGSMMGLMLMLWEVRRWRVVPVPSYVAIAVRPAAQYLFSAASYYAIAVAFLTILYAGPHDFLYVVAAAVLSTAGIGCLAGSYLGMHLLIDRSRQQLADQIAASYYRNVWPIANGTTLSPDNPAWDDEQARQAQLLELEKLMHGAGEETGLLYRVEYIVQGAIIQLSPTLLAILIVAIFARDQLLKIFVH